MIFKNKFPIREGLKTQGAKIMKKTILAVLAVMVMFTVSTVTMACSNQPMSAKNTHPQLALDPYAARAVMAVVAKDANGELLCSISETEFGTSRNDYAPSNGWASNVDVMNVYVAGGYAFAILKTKEPAGTTVHAKINGVTVAETPFSYNQF